MEEVRVGHLAEQRAPIVDDHELRLLGRARPHDLPEVAPQHGALAGTPVAEDQQVRLGVGVQGDRGQLPLVDAEQQPAVARPGGGPRLGADGVEVDPLGQEPQPGAAGPGPAGRDAGDEVLDAVAERGGAGVAVDPRQRGEEVQRPGEQAATGASGRHQRRRPAVDLGVQRIPETQLESGAEQVAHGGPEVRPAAGPRHHVQAERQPPGGELVQLDLEVVEVGAHRAPAVHDEEDVAVPVVDLARRAARPVGLDRVDTPGAEAGLAAFHDALHLGDDPAYDVGVGPRADPRDVGEPGERRERAAAEVEDVDAGLLRRRRQRQTGHDRPQQRALPAPGTPDHGDVTAGAAQVGGERAAALLTGEVDAAEGDDQAVEVPPPVGDQTEVRVPR